MGAAIATALIPLASARYSARAQWSPCDIIVSESHPNPRDHRIKRPESGEIKYDPVLGHTTGYQGIPHGSRLVILFHMIVSARDYEIYFTRMIELYGEVDSVGEI